MSSANNHTSNETLREEDLRKELRAAMQQLKSREPLDPKYTRLLMSGIITPRRPVLLKDKFYARLGSDLRARVETYHEQTRGKDPFDRIDQRKPLDESAMRAALTLRDAKEHEQMALLEATLASLSRRNGMDQATRRRHFDGVAAFLTSNKRAAATRTKTPPPPATAAEQTEQARQHAELEKQRATAKSREAARKRREEEEKKQRVDEIERRNNQVETPQHALQKLYRPIFLKLWNMEFPQLGGINPFRIVIDRDNCASVGAPDYFDIIKTPMNLTYIQHKVDNMEYESLAAFFSDVDLMIANALLYNSDAANPYHVAAQEMKKRYLRVVKKVLQMIQSQK